MFKYVFSELLHQEHVLNQHVSESSLRGQTIGNQNFTKRRSDVLRSSQSKQKEYLYYISRDNKREGRYGVRDAKTDAKHTAAGIPTWSPTVVLICRSTAYVWQSGRDAQFSADCGRMCLVFQSLQICSSMLMMVIGRETAHSF
jgi:hypothetical protein